MPSSDYVLKAIRYMEWERAKGSLQAILASYTDDIDYEHWNKCDDLVKTFIREFGELGALD